ncbi:Cof-type HAD-IIB family hydrolase [Ruminococcaceae bacterium OttesenSCG-928-O06]|nr:Cof-type HAD-IIB family hydrolase [Ruminococcaceae bacterium OttesenSCG-928-O06]
MEEIRLIGLDLDDTVLNRKKQLTPRVAAAIQAAIRRGIVVLPATGRALSGVPREFMQIPGVRYALTSNGAKVYDVAEDTELYSDCFAPHEALALLRMCEGFDLLASPYINGAAYATPQQVARYAEIATGPVLQYLQTSRRQVDDLAAFIKEGQYSVEKFSLLFFARPEYDRAWQAFLQDGCCTPTTFGGGNLELNTKTANKGAALLALAGWLGIARSGVMAVGDGPNDVEMLRAAGTGVAMANAAPAALAVADQVAPPADEEGVAVLLEELLRRQFPEG